MSHPEKIICKPTPWFLLRAGVILAMFSVFSVWFYIDGTTGYRQKNYEYYLHATFEKATSTFSKMNAETPLTEQTWREFASKQTVDFPKDSTVLPSDIELPEPWPEVLMDYNQVKTLQHNHLWRDFSGKLEYDEEPIEKPYDAGKIKEQFNVFFICVGLSLITLFFLLRTIRRSLIVDEKSLITADGKNIPYQSMRVLDLRKWATKGIAFIEYETPAGMKRNRIDGLTYGGFSEKNNQPAEQLMSQIRSNFTGEIVDYGEEKTEDLETEDRR
jgi:hypothetical protein